MKKWMLLLALALCMVMTGCASDHAEDASEAEPVDVAAAAEGEIAYSEYTWGTSYEEIEADKITDDMELGEDYALYEDTGDFAKELILNGALEGNSCQYYYSFNNKDELVSVMILLNGQRSDEEMAQLFRDQVEALKEQYGEPGAVDNEYESGNYSDMKTYIDDIKSEGSFAVWADSVGNQLTASAYKSGTHIEALLRYSVKGCGD